MGRFPFFKVAAAIGLSGALLSPIAALTSFTAIAASDRQVVHGEVLIASGPYYVGPAAAAACGTLDATTRFLTGEEAFAFRFEVNPKTQGRPFTLTPELPAALAVTFTAPLLSRHFESPPVPEQGGGLQGEVPTWAQEATVCLVAGPPSSFTYRAG